MNHPITPPPELVRAWNEEAVGTHFPEYGYSEFIATRAAQWGADQELDACCQWISDDAEALRIVRRPKPLSLAEEALTELNSISDAFRIGYGGDLVCDALRRALERLQQLEEQQ